MRNVILIPMLLLSYTVNAQFNFKTANEESGIIYRPKGGGLEVGYAFAESEARFTLGKFQSKTDSISKKNRFWGNNFKFSLPISDGVRAIYADGEFSQGFGAAWEYVFNPDNMADVTNVYFVRANFDIKQNQFGLINSGQAIEINKKVTNVFGITGGLNKVLSYNNMVDNMIISFSLALKYNINPVTDLKTKDYIIYDTIATNGVIQKTEKAYSGTQADFLSIIPKIDFVWTPFVPKVGGVEAGARFGVISSISSRYTSDIGKFAWNFGIGPSIHPKWSSTSVIAALQFEYIDFGNSRGDKTGKDIFGINFYVGIPLQFK